MALARNPQSFAKTSTKPGDDGAKAECFAADYLTDRGLKVIAKNVHLARAELDLVCRDANSLIFVEVRHRQGCSHGSAEESVTAAKQKKLWRAARCWLSQYDPAGRLDCRFDLVAINGELSDQCTSWIKNAIVVEDSY